MLLNETMALLGDGLIVDQNKDGVNVPELEQGHSVLLHCNVVHNDYLQNSKLILYFRSRKCFWTVTFYPTKSINTVKNNRFCF